MSSPNDTVFNRVQSFLLFTTAKCMNFKETILFILEDINYTIQKWILQAKWVYRKVNIAMQDQGSFSWHDHNQNKSTVLGMT